MADECRFYLQQPFDGILLLAAQQPEHILESPVGASVVAQCQTRFLFPQQSIVRSAYEGPWLYAGRNQGSCRGNAGSPVPLRTA